jgi:predicted small lipoprotein YifL
MLKRAALAALVLSLAACGQSQPPAPAQNAVRPQLDAPTPESEPNRVFAPANDAARAATGQLTAATALRLPDASQPNADAQEVLTLHGENGLIIEAPIMSNISPATIVAGQTLRALLSLPVEEPQVLVYRVTNETKPANGLGLCGANATGYVVVWEPSGPGEPIMKILGVYGGAPGAASARACPMLEYRRS